MIGMPSGTSEMSSTKITPSLRKRDLNHVRIRKRRNNQKEQQQKEHDVAQCRSSYLRMEPSITLYCHR